MKMAQKMVAIWVCILMIPGFGLPDNAFGITTAEEEDLTREFLYYTFENYKIIQDPTIVDYVNRVGWKILAQMPHQPFLYHFYVIQEDAYNAFAGPAGHIFINSGLLEAMESEDELAGILAHEISHVNCRHISHMIERSKITGMATLAGIAAGILLGIGGASEAASAVTLGSVAAGQSDSLAYSRENEMQADQVGLKYIEKAGYDVAGLLAILEKIRNKTWYGSDQIPTYLVTHPATEDRIAYIGAWLQSRKQPGQPAEKLPDHDFRVMHSRILALYTEKSIALSKLRNRIKQNPKDPFTQYAYGLVLSKSGDRKNAIVHLKNALDQRPFDQVFIRDLGQACFLDGQYSQALKFLESARSIPHFDPEGELYLARTLKELGRSEEAIQEYQQILAQRPQYSKPNYYLGEIYGEMGKMGDAHFHLGLYYNQERNYKNAIFHLNKALDNLSDPDKKKTAQAMLGNAIEEKEIHPDK
ncbi:MAG: M48 family metalloprotease [Pseudomonadota bacterium]